MIVLDASLAVKLVIPEIDSDAARRFYLDIPDEVVAPDLIVIEVAQAVVRRVNARDTSSAEGRRALRAWRAILDGDAITLFRSHPAHVEAAAELALELGHPVKDCLYLALALDFGADLVTCDAKFAAKARPRYPNVRLLADYA